MRLNLPQSLRSDASVEARWALFLELNNLLRRREVFTLRRLIVLYAALLS